MANEFLKAMLGDELFEQVNAKLSEQSVTLANLGDGTHIPKAKFDEANSKAKVLNQQIAELKEQLANASESQKDSQVLNSKIAQLTKDLESRDAKINAMAVEYKVKDALKTANARNADILMPLLHMDKISIGEDGKIAGLSEQIEALKKSDSYLFTDAPAQNAGFASTHNSIDSQELNASVNAAIRKISGRM